MVRSFEETNYAIFCEISLIREAVIEKDNIKAILKLCSCVKNYFHLN